MKALLALLALVAAAGAAQAAAPAPDAMVRQITDEVLATIRQDKAIQAADAAKLAALVQTKILPHFDFARATAIAVGPKWRSATPEQRAALTTEVTVSSQVRQSGAAPITIDYTMAREGDDWKVFDIAVDGLSLVENYRDTFTRTIDQRGVDGLIKELAAKNAGA